jgi:hypothetical protein
MTKQNLETEYCNERGDSSFTFDEVEKLLKTQRENCVVAVMKYITDDEILEKISDAPMYDYKK